MDQLLQRFDRLCPSALQTVRMGREMGHDALELYTEVKSVCAAL